MSLILAVAILILIGIALLGKLTLEDIRAEDDGQRPSFYGGFEIEQTQAIDHTYPHRLNAAS